jgi:hypothetical protein
MKSPAQYLLLIGGAILALTLLTLAQLPVPTAQAGSGLPPRATPAPTQGEQEHRQKEVLTGAYIELKGSAASTGSWGIVQWQDNAGGWHDVEGWQGTLPVSARWWVHPKDFHTGPFRWLVRQGAEGSLVGTSAPFSLPTTANQVVWVEMGDSSPD